MSVVENQDVCITIKRLKKHQLIIQLFFFWLLYIIHLTIVLYIYVVHTILCII